LLHVTTKQIETFAIILVLVCVVEVPIEWTSQLIHVHVQERPPVIFVPPTFQSHHNDNQPLLHAPNKQMETIVIILGLGSCGERAHCEWLNELFVVFLEQERSQVIFLAPKLIFMS
jgi:hypothetical protein